MLLAIDVGNTHIVLGCMEGREIKHISRLSTNRDATEHEYAVSIERLLAFAGIDLSEIDGAVISSVVPQLNHTLRDALRIVVKDVEPLIIGAGIKTGVNILIDNPAELGSDLLVAAAGALDLYKPPMAIIDMGTATTVTVVDKNGAFRGGAISPGVRVSIAALTSNTSLLPSISLEPPKKFIGTNTVDCMRSGTVLGAAYMIDGMLTAIEEELGEKINVIATGGLARYILPICKHEIVYNEDLLLYGLAVLYEKNKKK